MSDAPVLIVGGGIAGLAAANALAVRGYHAVVFEKTATPGDVDRGDVIHSSSLAFFDRWKALDVLREAHPLTIERFRILDGEGREIFSIDLRRELDPPAALTVLRHPDIERVLERAARRSGRVTVHRGVPVSDLLMRDGRVIGVSTKHGPFGGAFVVIADGAFSKIRDRHFGRRELLEYPVSFLNLRCRQIERFADSAYYVLSKRGVMIMVPLPGAEMRVGLMFARGERLRVPEAMDLVAARLSTFPRGSLEVIDATVYRLSRSLSDAFWIPGAALVGDAAHTTHPVGGQGMNMAFADAELLADSIAERGPCDDACVRYGRMRRREVAKILARTHAMGLLGNVDHPAYVRLREAALRGANEVSSLKRWVFRRIVDVR